MAELQTASAPAKTGGRPARKKLSPRVDLTAMVDMAFLLITFFILTTTLQKPTTMDLVMPDITGPDATPVPETRTMTILLGTNNKLEWYIGMPGNPLTQPAVNNFNKNGIRKVLLEQSARIKQEQGKEMIVLVKPSDKSIYSDVVAMMDELNLTNNKMRSIANITPVEVAMLKRDKLYD